MQNNNSNDLLPPMMKRMKMMITQLTTAVKSRTFGGNVAMNEDQSNHGNQEPVVYEAVGLQVPDGLDNNDDYDSFVVEEEYSEDDLASLDNYNRDAEVLATVSSRAMVIWNKDGYNSSLFAAESTDHGHNVPHGNGNQASEVNVVVVVPAVLARVPVEAIEPVVETHDVSVPDRLSLDGLAVVNVPPRLERNVVEVRKRKSAPEINKNCCVLPQKQASIQLHLELEIKYKSSIERNIFNAAVCLLSMVNIKCSLSEVKSHFTDTTEATTLKSKTIRHVYNRILEPRGFTLVPEENKWKQVFPVQSHNAILALVFAMKTPDGIIRQVCVYESASNVLIPMNNKGTVCKVGSTVIGLAAVAKVRKNRNTIHRTLSRHLYPTTTGSMYQIKLAAVYKLYRIAKKDKNKKGN